MDVEKAPEITGKTLQSMILGPKFSALPLDVRRRFSQNYNTKVTSPYEAAWAIIYAGNIDFETSLVLDVVPPKAILEEEKDPHSSSLIFNLSVYASDSKIEEGDNLFNRDDEIRLFPNLSKLKCFLVRFLELSLKTPGAHILELRMDQDMFPGVDADFFSQITGNATMENFLSHVRRNNWYQIVPGKIGNDSLYETLIRAESGYLKEQDLFIWKDINTLLIDPAMRAYISSFYAPSIQNQSLSKNKINEYLQTIENLPLRWVLM